MTIITDSKVLGDSLQEVFFPLIVVSQTARGVEDKSKIGFALFPILSGCQSNEGGQHHKCSYGCPHVAAPWLHPTAHLAMR